jgi:SARP family transcriptional regulator, regulator of embCAB operon
MSTHATAPATATSVLVVVVDDHTTFSDLLAMAVKRGPDLTHVGRGRRRGPAVAVVDKLRPDPVLMGVRLCDGGGVAAAEELTQVYRDLRVLVLTAHGGRALMHRAEDTVP